MSHVLDGALIAQALERSLAPRVKAVSARLGRAPKLALVACRAESAAEAFFARELKACADAGITGQELRVDPSGREPALIERLSALSADPAVDGVLVEFPLPPGFEATRVLSALSPDKDVEGLTALNQGRLYGVKSLRELERSAVFVPCTALALIRLLKATGRPVAGAQAVVIGRSSVVGRPVAHLLSCLDATVTLAHTKTRRLGALTADADILVAAAGKPGLIEGRMVKTGAIVLDAGATRSGRKLLGDVDYDSVSKKAGWITPVPGGVGPVTVAELLNAVVTAAEQKV